MLALSNKKSIFVFVSGFFGSCIFIILFKDVNNRSAMMVCDVKFGAKILLALDIRLNSNFGRKKMQACL